MTIGDQIRSLDDNEMAKFLEEFLFIMHKDRELVDYERRAKWLKQEVTE